MRRGNCAVKIFNVIVYNVWFITVAGVFPNHIKLAARRKPPAINHIYIYNIVIVIKVMVAGNVLIDGRVAAINLIQVATLVQYKKLLVIYGAHVMPYAHGNIHGVVKAVFKI